MSLYTRLAASARRMLAKYGQSMTLTRQTPGAYDTATSKVTNSSTTTIDKGVIFPYADGLSLIEGSMIQRGDQQVFINISTAPVPSDKLTVGSKDYSIVNVAAIEPAGVNVLYELQVRA